MSIIRAVVTLILAVLAVRGIRWAYAAFVLWALSYFPWQVGFHLHSRACELLVDARLALFSFTNYPHIVLFAAFFVLSYAHFAWTGRWRWPVSVIATLAMGGLLEAAEGVTGSGHCRLRDLLPDSAGAFAGALVVLAWSAIAARFPVPGGARRAT